jgi:hypothetical protein
MLNSLEEGDYDIDDLRTAFNSGADFARDVARDTIGALQAHVDAAPTDNDEIIRVKDDALAAARELLQLERSTRPNVPLSAQYESVLAIISNALIQS